MRCETFSGAGNIITMLDAPRRYTANMKELEAMKAESKKADEGTRDYIGSFMKLNSKRK